MPLETTPVSPPAEWGTPRTRRITWHDPAAAASIGATMSGIDYLTSIKEGLLPGAPMAALFDFTIAEISDGLVVFECRPDESAYNPIGVVHGGLVCTLADSVAGCAVHTTLDAGVGYTSIDINVSYLRAVTLDSGVLRATGRVTKRGRRVAFAAVEIVDGASKTVATATSSCLVMDNRGGAA
jgi:uncharacterized protein (TIGR00369 family)